MSVECVEVGKVRPIVDVDFVGGGGVETVFVDGEASDRVGGLGIESGGAEV